MTREGEHSEVIDQRARGQIQTAHARRRRSAVAVAMFLGALTLPILAATPALASSYTCTSASDPICQSLTPTFNCVWHDTAGNWTAVFGYQNTSSTYDITVPTGSLNVMSPGAGDAGQSTYFPRGTVDSAFTVPFGPPRLTWTLLGQTATATSSDKTCATPPVPAFGSPGVMLRTALIALPMLLVVVRTRRVQALVTGVPSVFRRVA